MFRRGGEYAGECDEAVVGNMNRGASATIRAGELWHRCHMSKIRNISGDSVRRYRDKLGLSQPKLALKCQLLGWDASRDTIASIEDGTRIVKDVEVAILAKVLGVTVNQLIPERWDEKLIPGPNEDVSL